MTPAELCERAVERLESTGWTQGTFGEKEGPNCLVGALSLTGGWNDETVQVQETLRSYFGVPITTWNDQPERTEFEVIDALKTVGKMFANGEITMEPVS